MPPLHPASQTRWYGSGPYLVCAVSSHCEGCQAEKMITLLLPYYEPLS